MLVDATSVQVEAYANDAQTPDSLSLWRMKRSAASPKCNSLPAGTAS